MKLKDLTDLDRDDLLDKIGLKRKRSADWLMPTLGALGVGILVGAGLGLLFAPKPGHELRGDLKERLGRGSELPNNLPSGTAKQAPRSI